MDNTLVLHTGRDAAEQEYAEYIKTMVGADACTGFGDLTDISPYGNIIFIFLYRDAKLPETVEDLFFERAGELKGRRIELVGIGASQEGFAGSVRELADMCGVEAGCRFIRESSHVYMEKTGGDRGRLLFVRELEPVEPEKAEETASEPARAEKLPEAEAIRPAETETIRPAEAPGEKTPVNDAGEPEEVPEDREAVAESSEEEAPAESFMDEEALAAAVRAMMAESEETVSQITDEVSAQFPDEEDTENEEPGGKPEEPVEDEPEEEGSEDGGAVVEVADREAVLEDRGEVGDGHDDPVGDGASETDSRDGGPDGEDSREESPEERETEPAGEVLPEEAPREESSRDPVGAVSWELASGETLKKYIRRAAGEEPWPKDEEMPAAKPQERREEPSGTGYRFIEEPVTAEEPAYEPPLGLKDLEAMEAEEAAEAVSRRERRKEREERAEEPGDSIIARAAAKILAFLRGGKDEEEDLDFGDEESAPPKENSFLRKLREDVGVYDEEDEAGDAEPAGDYDEDDSEEFEDDADFSDSFEDEEDEEDF